MVSFLLQMMSSCTLAPAFPFPSLVLRPPTAVLNTLEKAWCSNHVSDASFYFGRQTGGI